VEQLRGRGRTLATYGLASGPQGYRPLREFLVRKLKRDAGIACTADEILVIDAGRIVDHFGDPRDAAIARLRLFVDEGFA